MSLFNLDERRFARFHASARYRLVRATEAGAWSQEHFQGADLIAAMQERGHELTGFLRQQRGQRLRAELVGQPTFAGLVGPLWDRNAFRYENARANALLSD